VRTTKALATVFVVATSCTLALAKPNLTVAERTVQRLTTRYDAPGAQFAAAVNGEIVDRAGFGYSDVAKKTKVTAEQLFGLESCSKPITAMVAMKMIERGAFSLATHPFVYLGISTNPNEKRFASMTVRELMDHSSGLEDNIAVRTSDPMDVAKAAAATTLKFTPGQSQVYSNLGFNVLGARVEKAAGTTYQDAVKRYVFDPAGVTDAVALDGSSEIPNHATQYGPTGKVVVNLLTPAVTPAGGWVMSASDAVKILVAFDAGKIVDATSKAAMLAPPVPPLKLRSNGAGYGLGWDVVYHDPKNGGYTYGKNGGGNGAFTWMEHDSAGADFAVFYNGGTNGQGAQWSDMKPIERALAR
jgi:CubicO group peptidase (beta-lactamase class C family)